MIERLKHITGNKKVLSFLLVFSFTIGVLQILPMIGMSNIPTVNDSSPTVDYEVPIETGLLKEIGTTQPIKSHQIAYVENKDYIDSQIYTGYDIGSTTSFDNMRYDTVAYATLSEAPTFTRTYARTSWNGWMPLVTTPSTGWCEMEYNGHDDWEYDPLFAGQDDSNCASVSGDLGAVDEGIILSPVYDLSNAGYFKYSVYLYANYAMAHGYELEVYFLDNTGHYDWMFNWQQTETPVLGWGYKEILTNSAQYMHAGFRVKYQATDINLLQVCGVDVHRLEAYGPNRINQTYYFNQIDYDEYRVELLAIDLEFSVSEILNFEVLDGSIWRPVGSISAAGISYLNIHSYITSDKLQVRVTDAIPNYDYVTNEWHIQQMYLSMEDHIPTSYAMPVCDSLYDGNNIYAMLTPRSDLGDSYTQITTYHTDGDGWRDISHCAIQGYDGSSVIWSVSYNAGGDSYSIVENDYISSINGTEYRNGNKLHITWRIEFKFTHTDLANMDIRVITQDHYSQMTTTCDTNWDVETRLQSTLALMDDGTDTRGEVNGVLYAEGAISYYGSLQYPPDYAVDIFIISPEVSGSPWLALYDNDMFGAQYWTLVTADDKVGLDYYRSKVVEAGSGSDGTDLLVTDDSIGFIADRIIVLEYSESDIRANIGDGVYISATLEYEYDNTAVSSGTVQINGYDASHTGGGVWQIERTEYSVTAQTFDFVNVTSDPYGITVVNQNSQETTIIWDGLLITMTDPDDFRINVGDTATGIGASAVYSYDGTPYDGNLVLNSTTYVYDTVGRRGYTVTSASGDSYSITVILSNSMTWCIWDEIEVINLESSPWNLVNESFQVWCNLRLAYDNHLLGAGDSVLIADEVAVWNGSHFILEISFTHIGDKTFYVNSTAESTYGISLIGSNAEFLVHVTDMPSIESIDSDFEASTGLYQGVYSGAPLWIHWDPVNDPIAPSFNFTVGGADVHAWNVTSSWSGLVLVGDISTGTFVCILETGLPYSESNYTYTIFALNEGGYSVTQIVYITVKDYTDPAIVSEPLDIELTEGDIGFSIVWTCSDANPLNFEIRLDGILVESGEWLTSLENITISLDGLDAGEYVYEITIYDESGNSVQDSVTVVVNESTTTTTTTTTGTGIPGDMMTITLVIIFGGILIIVIFIIILKKR